LYEVKADEHLVCLWRQDNAVYFTTMKYAWMHNGDGVNRAKLRNWQLYLYVVDNNHVRHSWQRHRQWIPPSVRDKIPYRKLKTFEWRVGGETVENFLSMWYDEKHETLIALSECERRAPPQIVFLNKRNQRGLKKLDIAPRGVFAKYGSDACYDDDGCTQHLLIRHKPSKSWLCCIACAGAGADNECWIQFKLSRETHEIVHRRIVKIPSTLHRKKWLCYDERRDCLIGMQRLSIEEMLNARFDTKLTLFVVPRLNKLLQQQQNR